MSAQSSCLDAVATPGQTCDSAFSYVPHPESWSYEPLGRWGSAPKRADQLVLHTL